MKPNLVIGNPPYDKDIYLDFVTQAHEVSTDYTVMITPAKWQAKAGRANEKFRDEVVPYMRDIVYYPDTKEVFNIGVPSLTYFLLDKSKNNEHRVKNIENGIVVAEEITDDLTVLNLKAKSILTKLISDNPMQIETSIFGRLGFDGDLDISNLTDIPTCETDVLYKKGKKVYGYLPIEYIRKNADIALNEYKVMMSIKFMPDNNGLMLYIYDKKEIAPKEYICVYHGSLDACKSVVSYMQSNLISFVFKTCIQGTTRDAGIWCHIQDLKDWTVIYEDRPLPNYTPDSDGFYLDSEGKRHCSLYTRYNLTPDEIQLIESVIKTRTKKA